MRVRLQSLFKRKNNLGSENISSESKDKVITDISGKIIAKNIHAEGDVIIVIGVYEDKRGIKQTREIERISILELLERQVNNHLTIEKNSKKYIPNIFIEVANVKDQLRYFSHPVLFFQKILDDVKLIDFESLNRQLRKLELPQMEFEVQDFEKVSLSNVYDYANYLRETLINLKSHTDIYYNIYAKDSDLPAISDTKRYIFDENKYLLHTGSLGIRFAVDDIIKNINSLLSRVFFLTSRAGQGKTNFVCDFAETFLLRRFIPCAFFTGREFNHIAPQEIGKYFVSSIFGDRIESLADALEYLNVLAGELNLPTIIVFDGINEHREIASFSHHLEKFVETVIPYANIKIVFTCREEYYAERFRNFDISSFTDEIYFVKDLTRYMDGLHRDQLIEGYFKFFNMRVPYLSRQAEDILKNDTLLLRVFCEAYGDINAENLIQLPQIINIYRDSIFRKYFQRKQEGVSDALGGTIGTNQIFPQALKAIINEMIMKRQFIDIPVVDIAKQHYKALELLLGEDVIFRKDLKEVPDILNERIEVLNFTFDEFRDFLLANHLVNVTFIDSIEEFSRIVDEFVEPNSSVAEGIRTYLFFASRQAGKNDVFQLISQRAWYDEIFIRSIFATEEALIKSEDVDKIHYRFSQSTQDAKWIIKMLVKRWNVSSFPVLNITLLFEIFTTIDDDTYDKIVRSSFSESRYIFKDEYMWSIEALTTDLDKEINDQEIKPDDDFLNLFQLLIFLFPIWVSDPHPSRPAFDTFSQFSEKYPSIAFDLLWSHRSIPCLSIRIQVWRMFVQIDIGDLPVELAKEAISILLDSEKIESEKELVWIREVVWFLEQYALKRNLRFIDEALTEKMNQFS